MKKILAIIAAMLVATSLAAVPAFAQESIETENNENAVVAAEYEVATKAELNAALTAAENSAVILFTSDIDYGSDQLKIEKAVTLDLGGYTLTTANNWGGMSLKGNPTIKNGTINHIGNTAAIKAWNVEAFEDLTITVSVKTEGKTKGGIVIQEGTTVCVGSIKNVTINGEGLTNGIETYNCGNAANNVIGSMNNVTIVANGTGMLISAPCGTATNCDITGGVTGIEIWIKGNYSASLDLVDCEVTGNEQAVFAHDEFKSGVVNAGTLTFTADDDTKFEGVESGSALTFVNQNESKVEFSEAVETIIDNAAAMIGGKYYNSLNDAIADADDGAEIVLMKDASIDDTKFKEMTLTFNLDGNTLYVADGEDSDKETRINHINGANITYKNGTINIDDATDSVAIFGLNVYEGTIPSTVTFDNVVIEGDGYNSGYAVFYLNNLAGNKIVVTNSEIHLANEKGASGGVFKSENKDTILEISDTVMVLDNIKRGFVNMTTALTDTEIEFKNLNKTALRNFNGVIAGSYITIDGAEYGIENTSAGLSVEIKASAKNPSVIKVLKSEEEGIYLAAGNEITVANDGSELLAESVYVAEGSEIGGNFVSKADTIEVVFEKVDEEEVNGVMVDNAEGEDLYNINLVGSKDEIINRLNSADLTFTIANTTGKTSYEIIAYNEEVAINPVNNSDDRYEFHFNGKTEVETDTANIITIGQVKFSGYGIYTFSVDAEADTNVAHATTISDNIVDTFVPNDTATDDAGELIIDDSVTAEIFVPTRKLIINIDFPNTVNNNDAAYQDMTVTVSGADLETDLVIELGDNGDITDLAKFVTKTSADKAVTAVFEGGAYKVTITDLLNVNTTYTVTVEGAGYRTARYNVTMNCDDYKTLNFWNNVKDNAIEVEVGKETSEKNVTFLAGDIVKDSLINIYDLSAVVSYFGEIELDEDNKPEYAKYDLNRDGKIDSKDVAYVLVSWNN